MSSRQNAIVVTTILFVLTIAMPAMAAPLSPADAGFDGKTRAQNYNDLLDAMFVNGKTVQTVDGKMWVPWMKTSSSCEVHDLQDGNACNADVVDWNNNCMVSDEFSQVALLVGMGDDQQRMDQFYNTLGSIKSTFGEIPSWRIYRSGSDIQPCKDGINGNCDTASDATARFIIALYAASENPSFSEEARQRYWNKATTLSQDMAEHEILNQCYPTSQGEVCYWLAGGSQVKNGGMASNDFSYSGYYPDAIIAMLQACSQTGEARYCQIADDITKGYLVAAKWDGSKFTVSPGKSFKWEIQNGEPQAVCTNTCNPDFWDGYDAARGLGLCQANYYADLMGHQLPGLDKYCEQWKSKDLNDPSKAPMEIYSNGDVRRWESSYFAQGLQAMSHMGSDDAALMEATLDTALAHYVPSTGTWDYAACFGVYTQAFPMRALGTAIGLDEASFSGAAPVYERPADDGTPTDPSNDGSTVCTQEKIEGAQVRCQTNKGSCSVTTDNTVGSCRTLGFASSIGDIKVLTCEKSPGYAELYLQEYPQAGNFEVCIGDACVKKNQGFASYQMEGTCTAPPVEEEPVTEPLPQEPKAEEPTTTSGVEGLSFTCDISGGCSVMKDVTVGTCRTVESATNHGELQLQACEKEGGWTEVYRQTYPAGIAFTACLGPGCVDEISGFAKFQQ